MDYTKIPVQVDLHDLADGNVDHLLDKAFGPDSLGLIIIQGLSEEFSQLRKRVLSDASRLSALPTTELEKLESPEGHFLTGWSKGRENFSEDDFYDDLKGSFYVNCSFHKDASLERPTEGECDRFSTFKAYTTRNMWPREDLIPGFEKNMKLLCNLIIDVATVVAESCDRYCLKNVSNYEANYLSRIVSESTTTKARLLHYYPSSNGTQWCGEHRDHSCLTGLTSAMFLDETNPVLGEIDNPDVQSGLYIRDRLGETVQVKIPQDCLAFQTGSTLEEVSRGQFKAVPHYVTGCTKPGIARNTLAVFCQPSLHEMVTPTENFAEYSERILESNE
ncbi:unnamed protein product [Kuraishia capsulata CBS 1993]|uniref:Uncharacterized protein n=1 Tax=Kuraishia capsulata CBS 1993 TaxID=1382522 RepID=W6MX51_9ASCO|nr:uncharacterized protein KUCA_T00004262001 [Kuraishia capsulata CBS 1993]CDK28280.1 unnamed protein product [Kuraishia capsulata CBS 1993]